MSDRCNDINDCAVVKLVEKSIDIKISEITGKYDQVHEVIKENTQQMQGVVLAMATQTEAVKGLTESFKDYKLENEKEHTELRIEDKALHSRITDSLIKLAEQKGISKSNVQWKELIKIAGVFAIVSAFFKYILPIL